MVALRPRIGVIMGSTRPGRYCDRATDWFLDLADGRDDLAFERIDLRDVGLPFYDEPGSPAWGTLEGHAARAWQARLATLDGFVLVTPEYNHAPAAVLKNALDYAYADWRRKPVAFVGYGAVGAARAVEQLRLVCIELQMVPTRNAVHIAGADFRATAKGELTLAEVPHLSAAADGLLAELEWWATHLRSARSRS